MPPRRLLAGRRRSTKALGLVAALAGALAGCEVGPDFLSPSPPATNAYTPASEPDLSQAPPGAAQHTVAGKPLPKSWWNEFHSPDLDRVMIQAIADSPTLEASVATLAQAREEITAASGGLYPQLNMGAGFTREKLNPAALGFSGFVVPPFNVFSVGPTVSYALDIFGGTKRLIEERAAQSEYQGFELDAAYLTLTGNVANQAIQIASLRAQIKTMEDILGNDEQNLKLVQTSFDAGAGTKVDVLSAQSQLANDRTLLPPLRQQLSQARHMLSVLVGQAPADWTPPDFDLDTLTVPSELPVTVPSVLAHDRPDIRAAEAQLHAASAAVGVATANLYPNIGLSAGIQQEQINFGHLFMPQATVWDFGANLAAPLIHGGTLEAERRAAEEAYKSALAKYRETLLQAFGQVADVLEALAHDAEEIAAQREAIDVAEQSLKLTRLSYSAGNVGVLQVLDAERLDQQARLGLVRAEAQRLFDTSQLYLALGGAAIGALDTDNAGVATEPFPSLPALAQP